MIWYYSNTAHLLNEIIAIPKSTTLVLNLETIFLQRCADYINQTFELERMRIKQISTQASSDNYIALI